MQVKDLLGRIGLSPELAGDFQNWRIEASGECDRCGMTPNHPVTEVTLDATGKIIILDTY